MHSGIDPHRLPPAERLAEIAEILAAGLMRLGSARILRESPRKRAAHTRAQTPALLKGLIFGPTGRAMTPAHTRKGGKLYRYYVSTDVLKRDADSCTVRRVPAAEIESAVVDQLRGLRNLGGSFQCRAPATKSTATLKVSMRSNKTALR